MIASIGLICSGGDQMGEWTACTGRVEELNFQFALASQATSGIE